MNKQAKITLFSLAGIIILFILLIISVSSDTIIIPGQPFLPSIPANSEVSYYGYKFANYSNIIISTKKEVLCAWKPDSIDDGFKSCEAIFDIENQNIIKPPVPIPNLNFTFKNSNYRNLIINFSNVSILVNETFITIRNELINITVERTNETGDIINVNISILNRTQDIIQFTRRQFINFTSIPSSINTAFPFAVKLSFEIQKYQGNAFNFSINKSGLIYGFIDPTVTSCGSLGSANSTYTITEPTLSSDGTCITITANNITLEGNNSKITYGITGNSSKFGVYVAGANGTLIRNLTIEQGNSSGSGNYGVYFENANNGTLTNITIIQNGTGSDAIYLIGSTNITITKNNIRTGVGTEALPSGTPSIGIYLISSSKYNTIQNNNITTTGVLGGDGISIASSENNISFNTIFTSNSSSLSTSHGIFLQGGNNNTIFNNNITVNNDTMYGFYLISSSKNNITSNIILTLKDSAIGISLDSSSNNTFYGNVINTSGAGAFGISLVTNSQNNTFDSNTITTLNSTSYGIVISSSLITMIRNNKINIYGAGTSYGIRLVSGSNSSTVEKNTVTTWGGSFSFGIFLSNSKNIIIDGNNITTNRTSSYGMYFDTVNNNNISNNNITTWGSTAYGLFFATNSNSNIFSNMTIRTNSSNANAIQINSGNHNFTIQDSMINASVSGANDTQFVTGTSGTVNFTNITFNNKIGFAGSSTARLNVHWYFDSNVTQNNNSILPNVNVSGYNVTGILAFSNITGVNGVMGRQVVLAYWQNATKFSDQNNYTINYTKTGYNTTSISLNFTTNIFRSVQVNDSIVPTIAINDPPSQAYARNTSLPFNNTASDLGSGLSACKWNLDNGANSTVTCNSNITFNASEGTHTLNFYSNDSFNNLALTSTTFSINQSAPAVVLNFPANGSYLNYTNNIYLNYTPTDSDGISACKLYGDFNGTFSINQTNTNITNVTMNNFTIPSLSDNVYKWNVECNDTSNNKAFALNNNTFTIDTILPLISIDSITTTVGSQTVSFTSSYTETNCNSSFYSVLNSTNGIENGIENTSLSCNNMNSTFTVSGYATFSLKVYVRDKAGNENSKTSSFTTSQSSSGGGGENTGSSGGGGSIGKRANKTSDYSLVIEDISDAIIQKGKKKTLSTRIINNGVKFLNNCRLKGSAGFENWVESTTEKDLAPGQKEEFVFTLSPPLDSKEGDYDVILLGKCEENETSKTFRVSVTTDKFEFKINNIIDEGDNIRVIYSIEELSNKDQTVNVNYWLEKNNEIFLEGNKTALLLKALTKFEDEITLSKSDLISGVYELKIKGISEYGQSIIEENIVISKNPLTGLVTFIGTTRGLIIVGITLFIVLIIIFISLKKTWSKRTGSETFERGGIEHINIRKIPSLRPLKPLNAAKQPTKLKPDKKRSDGYKKLRDYEFRRLKEYGM